MHSIPEEALAFLTELRKNNNRDWFNKHKPKFKTLEAEMKEFYAELTDLLSRHDAIQRTKAYRIYRDIRFSKNKTPYKKHFAAHFARQKPALRGGYYLHIEPNDQSFIGGGFWNPGKDDLKRVRKEWEIDAEEIREILKDSDFKKHWGSLRGQSLKTAPMSFDRKHPNIDLINYKQWLFHHNFSDKEVLADDFAKTVDRHYQNIRPFFDYMSDVLTTDLNGVSLIENQ